MIESIPTNVCAKPEPGMVTKGQLKPVAIAFASIVLPVPGAPRKSRPRSRLPPAFSNRSPDCQRETMRRISSFASAWPRTCSSLTPHSASPGWKPRICDTPMASMGPKMIPKLTRKKIGRIRSWLRSPPLPILENAFANPWAVSPQLRPWPKKSSTIQLTVMSTIRRQVHRQMSRQNESRRRMTMSSARSSSRSSPNRLGEAMKRRNSTSTSPRNAATSISVSTSA